MVTPTRPRSKGRVSPREKAVGDGGRSGAGLGSSGPRGGKGLGETPGSTAVSKGRAETASKERERRRGEERMALTLTLREGETDEVESAEDGGSPQPGSGVADSSPPASGPRRKRPRRGSAACASVERGRTSRTVEGSEETTGDTARSEDGKGMLSPGGAHPAGGLSPDPGRVDGPGGLGEFLRFAHQYRGSAGDDLGVLLSQFSSSQASGRTVLDSPSAGATVHPSVLLRQPSTEPTPTPTTGPDTSSVKHPPSRERAGQSIGAQGGLGGDYSPSSAEDDLGSGFGEEDLSPPKSDDGLVLTEHHDGFGAPRGKNTTGTTVRRWAP